MLTITDHFSLDLLQPFLEKLPIGILIWQYDDIDTPENMRLAYSNPLANHFTRLDMKTYWGQTMQECFPDFLATGIPAQYSEAMREQKPRKIGPFMYEDALIDKTHYTLEAIPLNPLTIAILFENITEQHYFKQVWNEKIQKRLDKLTARENEILEEIILAKKSKEIARKLDIAVRTIETHRAHILMKMQVSSSVELTAVITRLRN